MFFEKNTLLKDETLTKIHLAIEVENLSFSSIVKNELCRIETNNKCCLLAELSAVIRVSGVIKVVGYDTNLKISTENAAIARRIFSLVKQLFKVNPEMVIRRSRKLKKHILYILVIPSWKGLKDILQSMNIFVKHKEEGSYIVYEPYVFNGKCRSCRKAYLRGAFLASGSMSDPEKTYHLEIINHTNHLAKELSMIVNNFNLNGKIIKRKGNHIVYLKEGENIVDFLNIIGAHCALLELENVRILKEMRNNVNRIVNCETANLQKTVDASVRQVENIKYIKENHGFNKLPKSLREIAEIRLLYSDANLKELGEMLNPPLGKSGVNHRLRKLDSIAEKIRESKGEL